MATIHKRAKRKGKAVALCGDRRARHIHNWWEHVDCHQCWQLRVPRTKTVKMHLKDDDLWRSLCGQGRRMTDDISEVDCKSCLTYYRQEMDRVDNPRYQAKQLVRVDRARIRVQNLNRSQSKNRG